MPSRTLRAGAAVLIAAPVIAIAGPAAATATDHAPFARQADASYAALQTYFAAGDGLYREQYPVEPGDNAYSYEWPFSQAHVAALDLAVRPGRAGARYAGALAAHDDAQLSYWHDAGSTGRPGFASGVEPPFGGGGDFFYDDNEWVGLQDAQHWAFFHDAAALHQAQQIFALVESGWDGDPTHPNPGGVFWTQAPWSSDRNTVSNMPGAELGLRLYQITGRAEYLEWARRMYDWTNANLQRPDGLYFDHVGLDGTIEKTVWSYNQGVPVGVNVLLYEVTGQRRYLHEAERIAAASYDYFVRGGRLDGQPAFFNSIYFKNLLLLESVTHGTRYRQAMADYAERMWSTHRDPVTGLFHFAAGGDQHVQMIEQAAMTQIYAVLSWPTSAYEHLY